MSETNKNFNECKVTSNINECRNQPVSPHTSIGKIITKVPVVLAELSLELNLDATITFPEPVLEIKDIKKRVNLTQCRLLLPTHKLFVKGFVRKNIQYASPSNEIEKSSTHSVASDLHSYTIDIPFECVTEIEDFLSMPVMPEFNNRQEFDFTVSKALPSGFPEKDKLLTSDLSQFHQESSQYYNELPFCELISSKIIEWDEAVDRLPLPESSPFAEGYFTIVEEKMVLDIVLKVLQNQQIRVTSTTNDDHCEPIKQDCKLECDHEFDFDLD
ncbi:CsxC family protein [Virgibacillus flavescens]|uniref:CsxC family protein n=1 Tax=Virgibacillus flavescens TaxID=1611422 RepID=UPI003D33375F